MQTRMFALIVGIVYLLVGIAGFIPGLVTGREYVGVAVRAGLGDLLGLFPVNVLHHLVHLLIGLLGILAYRDFDAARLFSRALAIVYGLLAILGLIAAGNLYNLFGLVPLFGHDIWLHAVTAAIAAYFGFAQDDAGEAAEGTARSY